MGNGQWFRNPTLWPESVQLLDHRTYTLNGTMVHVGGPIYPFQTEVNGILENMQAQRDPHWLPVQLATGVLNVQETEEAYQATLCHPVARSKELLFEKWRHVCLPEETPPTSLLDLMRAREGKQDMSDRERSTEKQGNVGVPPRGFMWACFLGVSLHWFDSQWRKTIYFLNIYIFNE